MKRIKALAFTDLHGKMWVSQELAYKAEEENVDVILVCGDITHFGSSQDAKNLLSPLIELRIPVLYVPGNCDPPSLVAVTIDGAECIHGISKFCGDIVFVGVGGSPITPFSTPFELDEETIMKILKTSLQEGIKGYKLAVVSHSPPKDTSLDLTQSGIHGGSLSVKRFVKEKKPSVLICGHIHEARGIDRIEETIAINPGPAQDGYYALLFIGEEVNIDLKSL